MSVGCHSTRINTHLFVSFLSLTVCYEFSQWMTLHSPSCNAPIVGTKPIFVPCGIFLLILRKHWTVLWVWITMLGTILEAKLISVFTLPSLVYVYVNVLFQEYLLLDVLYYLLVYIFEYGWNVVPLSYSYFFANKEEKQASKIFFVGSKRSSLHTFFVQCDAPFVIFCWHYSVRFVYPVPSSANMYSSYQHQDYIITCMPMMKYDCVVHPCVEWGIFQLQLKNTGNGS